MAYPENGGTAELFEDATYGPGWSRLGGMTSVLGREKWIAWQFHRPESDDGMIQVFRRAQSDILGRQFRLRGLKPDMQYEIRDLDRTETKRMTGNALTQEGIKVYLEQRPHAAVITYRRVDACAFSGYLGPVGERQQRCRLLA